jgi:hypothetical protein
VQDFGIELLMMWEDRNAVEKDVQEFKRMLGASNPQLIKTLWPESFKKENEDSQQAGWSHDKTMDKEEGLRLVEKIRQQKMSATLSDLEDTGWV